MAWNGSDGATAPKKTPVKSLGSVSAVHGIIALAAVLVIGGIVYLFVSMDSQPASVREAQPKQASAIDVVEPELPPPAPTEEVVAPKPQPEEEEYIEVNGQKVKLAADPKTGKPKYDKNVRIIPMRESDIKPRRFEFDAEEDIASLLEIEPGTPMYGEIPYGKRFKDSLMSSFMTPVEIKPTDDEYTRELKKQVQEVKQDLRELLMNGGDPAEEMRKAREELIELGRYRTSILQEINALRKSGECSAQDVRDLQDAANKMLEENGAKPIQLPAVLLRNMELKERRNQQ